MHKPLVSVIIPTHNNEKTIERCLDSIFNQTLKNIEIIVINDNSTDNTYNILKKYKNIVLINNKKNLGPSRSRNKGLDKAKGKYISFIDSDDYIDNKMYEEMIKFFVNDVDLVACSRYNIVNGILNERLYNNSITDSKDFLLVSHYVWDKLFKKDIIDKYNIRFPNDLNFAEDFVFLMKYRYYANKMKVLEEPYYYYYFNRDESICSSYNINKTHIVKALQMVIDFYKQNNMFDKYKEDLLEISIGYYVRRIREFKYYNDAILPKKITKDFLNYFKENYKNYKHKINIYKTKKNLFYRSSYMLMLLYIIYKQTCFKLCKIIK